MKTIVIALGGNALQQKGEEATSENELKNVMVTAKHIASIVKEGYRVVITHGNGPQAGRLLIQQECAKHETPPMPMDVCGAMSQGMIGYHIQQGLQNEFKRQGIDKPVCAVITQVEVDEKDRAFENPTKPIGPFYSEEEAKALVEIKGYAVKRDANRGFRRVVASPEPISVIEIEAVKKLVESGFVVITAGGGGVPVIQKECGLVGVEAIIDKDLASGVVAEKIGADILMILTEVENAYINFGKANQQALTEVTAEELMRYKDEGHFAAGSMLPKVEVAARFVRSRPWRHAVITSLNNAVAGLKGEKGTIVVGSN